MTPTAADEPGRLADNVLLFARALRDAGLPVGPASVVDALAAVEAVGVADRADFRTALATVLVKRREHLAVFDQAFAAFWRRRAFTERMIAMLSPVAPPRPSAEKPAAGAARVADALRRRAEREVKAPPPDVEIDARLTVSGREVLQAKDFAQMSAAEIAEAKRLIGGMSLPADRTPTRRLKAALRGAHVDLRRTFRRSLGGGGGFIDLAFRAPGVKPPPLVAICDISGSMAQYTRVFLHFLHAVTDDRRRVSSFLFGTRLTNVTRALDRRDVDDALARCGGAVADWSGGTRIATSLNAFNRDWSRRVLGQGAVVLLFTDGLERELDDGLAFEMDRLRRSCKRLIWLNPLLRFDGFTAKAGGIRAMLPHVDEFRPIHNLASMADLCAALSAKAPATTDPKRFLRETE